MVTASTIQGNFGPPFCASPPVPVLPRSSLLDKGVQNCPLGINFVSVGSPPLVVSERARRRRGRSYHRAVSGLRLRGEYRLLTLTTSPAAEVAGKQIVASWRALVQRMRRRGMLQEYFKVIEYTKKGLPHIHMVFRGNYVAREWVSLVWAELHLSPVIDIRAVRRARDGSYNRVAGYLAKYLGKDLGSRYSCSWGWVWRGFAKDWHELCSWGWRIGCPMESLVEMWGELVDMLYGHPLKLAEYRLGVSYA